MADAEVRDLTSAASRAAQEREDEAAAEAGQLNGGKSIEDLANDPDSAEDEEGQQFLDFGDAVNLAVKGKRPTESQLKIRPISRDITGQLGDKGDDETYAFLVVGKVHKIEIVNRRDGDDGRIMGKVRRHILDPMNVKKVPEGMLDELLDRLD